MPLTFDIAIKLLSDKSVSFCFGLLSTHRLYTSFMSTVSDYLYVVASLYQPELLNNRGSCRHGYYNFMCHFPILHYHC